MLGFTADYNGANSLLRVYETDERGRVTIEKWKCDEETRGNEGKEQVLAVRLVVRHGK